MFIDFITDLFKFIFYTTAAIILLLSIPFIIAHVAESDEREEYPHSGFCPDCPEWIAPEDMLDDYTHYIAPVQEEAMEDSAEQRTAARK